MLDLPVAKIRLNLKMRTRFSRRVCLGVEEEKYVMPTLQEKSKQ
jgi:hypothetical protein